MSTANQFKFDDAQIAKIICESCELVAEDARPAMAAHLYELAWDYNENGCSTLFVRELEKFLRKVVGESSIAA